MSRKVEGPLDLNALRNRDKGSAVSILALGTFDGVHYGHQQILSEAIRRKEAFEQANPGVEAEAVAFTFDNLPLEVLRPAQAPARLMTTVERCKHIVAVGIDRVVMAKFDLDFAQQSPEAFVEETLFSAFNVGGIVVGFNHTFGHLGRGNVALLRELAAKRGVDVGVVEGVQVGGELVSSTMIRRLIADGDCVEAATFLGRPFFLEGEVIQGHRQGRLLGFPTANIRPDARIVIPADGVYLTRAEGDGVLLGYALTVVSRRPTFEDTVRSIETFILDFSGDLYGKRLRVSFLQSLRGVVRFSGADALKAQIERDVQTARERIAALEAVGQAFT